MFAKKASKTVKGRATKTTSATKGKGGGSKKKLTQEQEQQIEADAESFKADAIAYAKTAYAAALAHFEKHSADPFARSRLAVVFGETHPGDVHMVVTLPGRMRDSAVGDEDVHRWIHDAELLARTLEHPECTEAFKSAFGAIYTEHMLDGSGISWTSPEVLRVMLPLVMLAGSGTNHVCDDHTALDILKTLSSELMSDQAGDEVRAFLAARRPSI
jgi:hypothetical protein